jgi:hypothetical protein
MSGSREEGAHPSPERIMRRANAFGLMMSLNMLIEPPAGFDYTGADIAR